MKEEKKHRKLGVANERLNVVFKDNEESLLARRLTALIYHSR